MSRRQATTIIALLAVIAVALVALVVYLVTGSSSGGEEAQQSEAVPSSETSAPAESIEQEEADSVALLEGAGFNVVMPPPVPDAPGEWGDYVLDGSWDGQVRVFEGQADEPVRGEDDGQFPATMNGCGTQMYLVTFRSVAEPVLLDAQLINAVGEPVASEILNGGWMLGTNCVTPSFAFDSSTADGSLTDVAYTVYSYRQSSVASDAAQPQEQASSTAPPAAPPATSAPFAPAEPTFVRCAVPPGQVAIYSDGSWRSDSRCENSRTGRVEGVCGGMYGWQKVSREEYIDLCGVEPPTGG